MLGMLSLYGIDLYVRISTKNNILIKSEFKNIDNIESIIVLGAGLKNDGTPSPMLQERLDKGIELYNEGIAKKIIMSGDHEDPSHDEVNAMKDYATSKGVPSEDIFMDHAGLSTYDSIYRAKEIFNLSKIAVVTQKYHLYRALFIAKNLGIDAYGFDAETKKYSGDSYRKFREFLARDKDFFKSILKPSSTFTGDSISVLQSGNITNDKDYIIIKSLNEKDPYERYLSKRKDYNTIMNMIDSYEFSKKTCDGKDKYELYSSRGVKYGLEVFKNKIHITKNEKNVHMEIELNETDSNNLLNLLEVDSK